MNDIRDWNTHVGRYWKVKDLVDLLVSLGVLEFGCDVSMKALDNYEEEWDIRIE